MAAGAVAVPTLYRFTRDEYHRMGDAGLFVDKRVELLDGEIITMPPQNPPHAGVLTLVPSVLMRVLGASVAIRIQLPIMLDDWSEPEPDIAVCLPDPDSYMFAHPRPDQILLLIEVAGSSLPYDRGQKTTAYARSNIPEYWILNLIDRKIEMFSDPDPVAQRYRVERSAGSGDMLLLPGGVALAAADILPHY